MVKDVCMSIVVNSSLSNVSFVAQVVVNNQRITPDRKVAEVDSVIVFFPAYNLVSLIVSEYVNLKGELVYSSTLQVDS